ncbi:MAG: helix-turn-helix domain-containing protein [Rickettsiales bacterium]
MHYTPKEIGKLIRDTRKSQGITQKQLSLVAGTGIRFIIELERGKETSHFGKVLLVLRTLGIKMNFITPK